MSYSGETSSEAQERARREKEAVAFLTSLGPQFQKAHSSSPGPKSINAVGQKATTHAHANGGVANGPRPAAGVVNGTSAGQRHAASSSTLGSAGVVQVTVSPEVEEKRQQALRRLKATHCSVNHDKVATVIYM